MSLAEKLQVHLNTELVKRLLIRYFKRKGFEDSFDVKVYPPSLQDIPEVIPELSNKIEVVPFVIETDPHTKFVRIGWNLFVLGNQRMFLGESEHASLRELEDSRHYNAASQLPSMASRRQTTPKKIVYFICKVLGDKEQGTIRSIDLDNYLSGPAPTMANTYSANSMWNRPKPIRPEGTPSY